MRRRALLLAAVPVSARADELFELNHASRAELESLPGLGPQKVEAILSERLRAPFDDWASLRRRVKGLGPKLLQKISDGGLRVNGRAYASDATP